MIRYSKREEKNLGEFKRDNFDRNFFYLCNICVNLTNNFYTLVFIQHL